MKTKTIVPAFACALALFAGCEENVELKPGMTDVVVPEEASLASHFAGSELTNFLSRAWGVPVPLVKAPLEGRSAIILGTNALSRAQGLSDEGLEADVFRVKAVGPHVYLLGRDSEKWSPEAIIRNGLQRTAQTQSRATLNAVYDFLERHVGVRFYFPGEMGTVVPKAGTIFVPAGERTIAPVFKVRKVHMYADGVWYEGEPTRNYKPCPPKNLAWLRLRLQCREIPCSHGQTMFWYPERFAATNPEYFQLRKDGTRCTNVTARAADCRTRQLCHTSKIWDEMYKDVKSYLTGEDASVRGVPTWAGSRKFGWGENTSERMYVDVMNQDGFQECFCANCQAAYDKSYGLQYATELIWNNTVKLANRLRAEGVKGYITQMAYQPYANIPKVDIPDNVLVMVAEGGPWSKAEPEKLKKEYEHVRSWAEKAGGKVWTWTYPGKIYSRELPNVPQMSPRAWGEYFQTLSPHIFGGFCESESDRWIYNYLNYYVFAKLGWDPSLDLDALLDEHHRMMFGKGAAYMKEIYEAMEKKWVYDICGTTDQTPLGPVNRSATFHEICDRIYSPSELDRMEKLYDQASAAAGAGTVEARRVAFIKRHFHEPLAKAVREYAEKISVERGLAERKRRGPAKNLLENGDFSSLKGWASENGSYKVSLDTSTFVSPPSSIKLVSTNRTASLQYIDGKLKPGAKYRLSFFLKLEDVRALHRWCGVFAEYFDTWTWHYFPKAAAPVGTFDWCYQEYEFTVDKRGFKEGRKPWFHLMLNRVTGTAWFDDVCLEEIR